MLFRYALKLILLCPKRQTIMLKIYFLPKVKYNCMIIWMIKKESQTPGCPMWPGPFPVVKSEAINNCHLHFSTGNQESQS